MKQEFLIQRQGKTFSLYAGLVDEAHANGLLSIETELLQVPTEENKQVAICRAVVKLQPGGLADPRIIQTFTGIGDASPQNVAPPMRNCLIRFAETRAKARALRDAVNVGVAAFEELGDEDGETPAETPVRPTPRPAPAAEETPNVPTQYEQCPECHAPHGKRHGDGCKVGVREAQRTMAAMAR